MNFNTNSYATFKMKLKELENVNAIISTNKTSDFYQIIARLKNVDSNGIKKQGELPFTPVNQTRHSRTTIFK